MELPNALPYAFRFDPNSTALVIIDMQRDFLYLGGFGDIQCGDSDVFNNVRNIVPIVQQALKASRKLGLHVMHTREGHLPDLSDLPASKRLRQTNAPNGHHTIGIGESGPMGRLLIRGEYGHDIIDELRPLPGETVIDKPGKGSFWKTGFHRALLTRGITHLLLAGVTTECCVNTTAREAADRGFECCILADCTSGFDDTLVKSANNTICAYDGLFGYVGISPDLVRLSEAQVSLDPIDVSTAKEDLSLLGLSQAYCAHLITPVEIARIVAEQASEYQIQNPGVSAYFKSPDLLFNAAKALQEKFTDKPLPPLYGVPFVVDDRIRDASTNPEASQRQIESGRVVEALTSAGALFVGNMSEPSLAVATRLVSFTIEAGTINARNMPGPLKSVTAFHPTPGTLTSGSTTSDSLSIVAQSATEARKIWLVVDQHLDKNDMRSRPQSTINSWVWHVDFRGPRNSGFIVGIPKGWSKILDQPSVIDSKIPESYRLSVKRLQDVGGQVQEIEWEVFEQAKQLSQDMLSLSWAESVSMKAVLNLQSDQKALTRRAARIFETIDVLLAPTACPCSNRHELEGDSMINMLNLCGVDINIEFDEKQREDVCSTSLVGATGREGAVFDIARELERMQKGA